MEERTKFLTASLIIISKEKQQRLEAIKNLTLAQSAEANKEDTDDLLENMTRLIGEKQRKIEEINLLDQNFKKLHTELESLIHIGNWQNAGKHPDSQIRALSNILEKNTITMREIQAIDIENTNKMQENLKQIQEQLKKVRQGKKAAYGYDSNYGGVDAYFVDKKR